MNKRFLFFAIFSLLLLFLLSACVSGNQGTFRGPSDEQVMPQNVLQLGDTFEFFPGKADGHFICSVTDARVVTEASDCPEKVYFLEDFCATVDGEYKCFEYEQWFTDGGAIDSGCHIVIVDVSITNVDAVAWLDSAENRGFFEDPYMFYGYEIVQLADLTDLREVDNVRDYGQLHAAYISYLGQYAEKDDPLTMGIEPYAIRIQPGETVNISLGFLLPTYSDGRSRDLSMQWLCRQANSNVEDGLFIDIGLGDSQK